jgi:cytochrome b561
MPRPERVLWHDHLLRLHINMSYVGMSLVVVHVSAALYHHFGRRDDVLTRMLPRRRVPISAGSARARSSSEIT